MAAVGVISGEGQKLSAAGGEGFEGWLGATNELLLTYQTSPVVSTSLFALALICTYLLLVFDVIHLLSLHNLLVCGQTQYCHSFTFAFCSCDNRIISKYV